MTIQLIHAECVAEMNKLADRGIVFDAICTDAPYHLTSIVKRFSKGEPEHTQTAKDIASRRTPHARLSKGFMNAVWDGGDVAFRVETWQAAYRVLKPGGWLLSFGSTRGHHRMACAIEDAGFEIRDSILNLISSDTRVKNFVETLSPEQVGAFAEILQQAGLQGLLAWVYGSSMPKSLNVERSIAEKLCTLPGRHFWTEESRLREKDSKPGDHVCPSCKESLEWDGYGTGLKPAYEIIVVARKPIEKSVADNVLKHRTGALNIDATRIGTRYPANVILDGSEEVLESFAKYGENKTVDTGTAAGYFYSAKAGNDDRIFRDTEEVKIEWISENGNCQVVLQADTGQLPQKVIVVSGLAGATDAREWSTFLCGSGITALCQRATSCTIKTGTSWTTASTTWNYLIRSLISASTADVISGTENGGSLAENVGPNILQAHIMLGATESLPGAESAASKTQLIISVSAKAQESHPTIKPVSLIYYLLKLVVPKGGSVLDPFAGTGTIATATHYLNVNCTMIEADATYAKDIEKRIKGLKSESLFSLVQEK